MKSISRRWRSGAVATATAAVLGGTMIAGVQAQAVTVDEAPSTPVDVLAPDGMLMSYVVNTRIANPGQTSLAEIAIVESGGVVVQSWPQIGVVIAHSDRAAFRTDVVAKGKNVVASVGATRTASVKEGTPAGLGASWGPGASGYKKGQKKPTNGDLEAPSAPADTTDPREGEQWDMTMIKADQAHQITDGSRNVLVGVLDSGIDPDHPDLVANISVADSVSCNTAGRPDTTPGAWAPTTSDHGTHVAGTIAASRNGVGIVGVAPNVRMASVKVVNDDGFIYPEYAICGFMWAGMKGMDVTNNSYYVDPYMYWCGDQADQGAALEAMRRAVAWSTERGVLNVAAMGNASHDTRTQTTDASSPNDTTPITRTINSTCKKVPAALDGVVGVSSLTSTKQLSYFSNRGLGETDVAAPGSSILSTIVTNNGYGRKSGTSMASPHAAGVLALMKSAHPSMSPAQMAAKLRSDAMDTPCSAPQLNIGAACEGTPEYNSYYGDGIIDALKAVQ